LTALLEHGERNGEHSRDAGVTADDLAQRLGITPSEARVIASELARAGCLRIGRMPNGRARNGGRYAQAVALPVDGEQCGLARQPRMRWVGLLIETDTTLAEQFGRLLREEGVMPVAVPHTSAALLLLKTWAFEVILLDCASRQHPLTGSELSQAYGGARAAGCGPLVLMGGPADLIGIKDAKEKGLSRVRVVAREREQVRAVVAEAVHGVMTPVAFSALSGIA
jgi:hypothetical protein